METDNYTNIHMTLRFMIIDGINKSKKYPALIQEGSELETDAQVYDYLQGKKDKLIIEKGNCWKEFVDKLSPTDKAKIIEEDKSFEFFIVNRIKSKKKDVTAIEEQIERIEALSLGLKTSIESRIENINSYVKSNGKLANSFILINSNIQKILGISKKEPDKVLTKNYNANNQE